MTTLIDFLLARIAEDEEQVAGDWHGDAPDFMWGPQRIKAECEAKRRIVELWSDSWDDQHGPGSAHLRTRMTDDQFLLLLTAERVLGYLALPYADHPDYRDEWKP